MSIILLAISSYLVSYIMMTMLYILGSGDEIDEVYIYSNAHKVAGICTFIIIAGELFNVPSQLPFMIAVTVCIAFFLSEFLNNQFLSRR